MLFKNEVYLALVLLGFAGWQLTEKHVRAGITNIRDNL